MTEEQAVQATEHDIDLLLRQLSANPADGAIDLVNDSTRASAPLHLNKPTSGLVRWRRAARSRGAAGEDR